MKYTTTEQVIHRHFVHPFHEGYADYIDGYLTASVRHIHEALTTRHLSEREAQSLYGTLDDLIMRAHELREAVQHWRAKQEQEGKA